MKRLMAITAAGLLLVAGAAATTSASSPVVVGIAPCHFSPGSTATVPAGESVVLRIRWFTTSRGLVNSFLHGHTVAATVDGAPVADAQNYWGPIETTGPDEWMSFWTYPLGALDAGESVTLTFDTVLEHQMVAGHPPEHYGPGSIFGGPIGCTITAV